MSALRYDDLPSMALFAEVVRARSFSAAARKTGIAKSAVSKRVAQLEARLGVRLLVRTTRKLALTSEGARFYEHCDALLGSGERALAAVSGASDAPHGKLRVNAPVTLSQRYLARVVAAFLAVQPDIDVELVAEDGLVDVVEGGYDLTIRVTRLADSSLVAKQLTSTRLVVCAAPPYLAARGTPQDPSELLHHVCLHYARVPFAAEWRFRGPDGPYVVPAKSRLSTGDGTVLREAATAGLGLAVLPWFMVAREVHAGRLVTVLEGHRRARIGIYALMAHRQQPLRTRLLLSFLVKWFGREGWELA